jgi:hypothetical protein
MQSYLCHHHSDLNISFRQVIAAHLDPSSQLAGVYLIIHNFAPIEILRLVLLHLYRAH